MIDTDRCPNAVDTKETDKHLKCEGCGKFFLHDKRGRKPSSCEWYRKLEKKEQAQRQEKKAELRKNSNMVAIPKLDNFSSLDEVKVGMVVYTMSSTFSKEISRRSFARDYKVLSLDEGELTIIRNAKLGHKNYPVRVGLDRVYKKTGYDYVDKTDDDYGNEEEDDQ